MAKVIAAGEHKLSNIADRIQQQAWTEAFGKKSADAFEHAFAEDVVLEASALVRCIEGIDQVKSVMAAACGIYEALMFTQETTHGPRTYLEWKAEALGNIEFLGVTALTKNDEGKITRIRLSARTTLHAQVDRTGLSPSNSPVGEASTSREMETQKLPAEGENRAWREVHRRQPKHVQDDQSSGPHQTFVTPIGGSHE